MSNGDLEQEQSPESAEGNPVSEEMKGDETQKDGTTGQLTKGDDDPTSQRPMPRPEDYDFFLNVRHREQKEPNENDKPTEQ